MRVYNIHIVSQFDLYHMALGLQMPSWQPGFYLGILNGSGIYTEEIYVSLELPKHTSKKKLTDRI
jgi:hypothetical protein